MKILPSSCEEKRMKNTSVEIENHQGLHSWWANLGDVCAKRREGKDGQFRDP